MLTAYHPLGPATEKALAELGEMSAEVGNELALIQGAGGNSSVKLDDVLWIKASGKWLAHAQQQALFVPMRLSGVRARIQAGEADPVSLEKLDLLAHSTLRPSIETSLHALMPQRVVLHVHSVAAIALSVCQRGAALIGERLVGLNWVWVPYAKPGVDLTEAVKRALPAAGADILLLANHGLVVGGESTAAVAALLAEVEARLRQPLRPHLVPDIAALETYGQDTAYQPAKDAALHAIALDPRQLQIVTAGTLYPDHVVFLGPAAHALPEGRALPGFLEELQGRGIGPLPLVLVPGAGVLLHRDIQPGEWAMVACLVAVASRIPAGEALNYLSDTEVCALLNWDAEAYRKSLAREVR